MGFSGRVALFFWGLKAASFPEGSRNNGGSPSRIRKVQATFSITTYRFKNVGRRLVYLRVCFVLLFSRFCICYAVCLFLCLSGLCVSVLFGLRPVADRNLFVPLTGRENDSYE